MPDAHDDSRPLGPVLRVIIADDEAFSRRLLVSLLNALPEVELVAECSNGREALKRTRELAPDLLILDIRMPGMSGFDVIKELQSDLMPNVVFCTAWQRYAVDAFDLHAVDYLLKPVDGRRLGRAVARARQRLDEQRDGQAVPNKRPLVGAIDEISRKVIGTPGTQDTEAGLPNPPWVDRKLAVRTADGTVLVDTGDIAWVDAAGDYMCLHVKGETLILRSTLTRLMQRLDPERFKRIHRSTVVNLERISRVTPLKKGEYRLDLGDETQLKVSRHYRAVIRQFLDQR